MQRWAKAYAPSEHYPVPGMTPADFARLKMPVLIYRSSVSGLSHTRCTSEWVHDENWAKLAPVMLEFCGRR